MFVLLDKCQRARWSNVKALVSNAGDPGSIPGRAVNSIACTNFLLQMK